MKLWVSCKKFTVFVEIDENEIIVDTALVVRKFIGQPIQNLCRWFKKFGDLKVEELHKHE